MLHFILFLFFFVSEIRTCDLWPFYYHIHSKQIYIYTDEYRMISPQNLSNFER